MRLRVLLLLLGLSWVGPASAIEYLSTGDFVAESFAAKPELQTLWLKEPHQAVARELLGHPYRALRLRYWKHAGRTAWILEEIGKEQPITIGVVVENGRIEQVRILAYRESRGGEVRHPFFMEQFVGASLVQDRKLSTRIDGIAGATLSVRAVSNISRFALYLHDAVQS